MWNQFFPERASTIAGDIDLIFSVVLGLSLFFAVPVAVLVVIFAVRYRRGVLRQRFEHAHEGRGGGETWLLEISWIVLLLILALGVFSWGACLYFNIYAMPANGMDVYVVGKQWMWKFQHPTGQTEIDELHVPVDFPVRLTMISEDVIHSFYVPAFRIKRDVLPGEYTTVWFEATETGTYNLFCAEYCGTDHSRMLARVVVMDAAAYQSWLSERGIGGGSSVITESSAGDSSGAPPSMADAGEQLFTNLGCLSCHRADGNGTGPSLVGLWGEQVELASGQTVTADINYVRRSILDPQAELVAGYPPVMPTYEGQVSEEELLTLVEYIQSLGESAAEGDSSEGGSSEGDSTQGDSTQGDSAEDAGQEAAPEAVPEETAQSGAEDSPESPSESPSEEEQE